VAAKRKPKRATQPEEARTRAQLLLRLPPVIISRIRARAASLGRTISEYMETLVEKDLKR
jgi:predicted DNA-binding protein